MQPVRVKDLFELLHPLGVDQVDLKREIKTRCELGSVQGYAKSFPGDEESQRECIGDL